MSSQNLQEAVARNSNWINSVITNSKLSSQLSELLSINSLDQKISIQEGNLDAKFVNAKTLRGYKGTWEADTNSPILSNSSGVVGDVYKVSVGGTIDIGSGSITYVAGDLIYLSDSNWIKISPNQISDIIGLQSALDAVENALVPKGTWNASTNIPDINQIAETGHYWIVSNNGSTDLGGITDWKVSDWAIKTSDSWVKIDNSEKITEIIAGNRLTGGGTEGALTINHENTTRTDTTSSTNSNTFSVVKSVSTDSTGHLTSIDLNTITVPDNNTTYSLSTSSTGTSIRLSGNPSDDDVLISGTTGRTSISRINDSELRVNLTDDVVIINDLIVGGELTVEGTGTSTFDGVVDMSNHKILNVQTGTSSTDAVNLGQVELLVAGVGVFKGAYNASSNLPALEGSSNISLDTGDYFVVNVAGTFFTESLQVGDNIFAAVNIAANSSPSLSNYTVIQAGANIAGAGSQDVFTQKGIAGFDAADFLVSSSGYVSLNSTSNPFGTSVILTGGVNSGTETIFTVDVRTFFGASASAQNCKIEVIRITDLETVYPVVDRNGSASIAFKFSPIVANSAYKALISIV